MAVEMEPANAPDAIFTKMLVEPNAESQAYFDGSYKPRRRPPYRRDLVNAGVNPRYRDFGPSFFNT